MIKEFVFTRQVPDSASPFVRRFGWDVQFIGFGALGAELPARSRPACHCCSTRFPRIPHSTDRWSAPFHSPGVLGVSLRVRSLYASGPVPFPPSVIWRTTGQRASTSLIIGPQEAKLVRDPRGSDIFQNCAREQGCQSDGWDWRKLGMLRACCTFNSSAHSDTRHVIVHG